MFYTFVIMCLILVLHEKIYAPSIYYRTGELNTINGKIKFNLLPEKLTFYLIYLSQLNNSFGKTVKTRMTGAKVNHNVATQQ